MFRTMEVLATATGTIAAGEGIRVASGGSIAHERNLNLGSWQNRWYNVVDRRGPGVEQLDLASTFAWPSAGLLTWISVFLIRVMNLIRVSIPKDYDEAQRSTMPCTRWKLSYYSARDSAQDLCSPHCPAWLELADVTLTAWESNCIGWMCAVKGPRKCYDSCRMKSLKTNFLFVCFRCDGEPGILARSKQHLKCSGMLKCLGLILLWPCSSCLLLEGAAGSCSGPWKRGQGRLGHPGGTVKAVDLSLLLLAG